MTDREAIWDLTPREFERMVLGVRLRNNDDMRDKVQLVYLSEKAKATNKKGKPSYTFKQVYDHEKYEKEIYKSVYGEKQYNKDAVDRLRRSMKHAEDVLNKRVNFELIGREEDNNVNS